MSVVPRPWAGLETEQLPQFVAPFQQFLLFRVFSQGSSIVSDTGGRVAARLLQQAGSEAQGLFCDVAPLVPSSQCVE